MKAGAASTSRMSDDVSEAFKGLSKRFFRKLLDADGVGCMAFDGGGYEIYDLIEFKFCSTRWSISLYYETVRGTLEVLGVVNVPRPSLFYTRKKAVKRAKRYLLHLLNLKIVVMHRHIHGSGFGS